MESLRTVMTRKWLQTSVTLTPQKGQEQGSGPRSDEVVYDEDEDQTAFTSSKVTFSGVEEDPPRCRESSTRKRQESGEESQSHVWPKRQRGQEGDVNLRLKACLQDMRLKTRRMMSWTCHASPLSIAKGVANRECSRRAWMPCLPSEPQTEKENKHKG